METAQNKAAELIELLKGMVLIEAQLALKIASDTIGEKAIVAYEIPTKFKAVDELSDLPKND